MPYRRRSYRRRSGRRFRRRPSIGRAVLPRGQTFAPRHQYLKLKKHIDIRDAVQGAVPSTTAVSEYFAIPLQRPQDTGSTGIGGGTQYTYSAPSKATGWDAYGNLFQSYVVAGVKVKVSALSLPYEPSRPCAVNNAWNIASTATALNPTQVPTGYQEVAQSPLGRTGVCDVGRPYLMKRYINMNTVFGEVVKKHDAYVHGWTDAYNDATNGRGCLLFNVTCANTGTPATGWHGHLPHLSIELVYYIHAVHTNPDAAPPALMAQLKSISSPTTGGVGEGTTDAFQRQGVLNGRDIPNNLSQLKEVNRFNVAL